MAGNAIARFFSGDGLLKWMRRQLGFIVYVFLVLIGLITWNLHVEKKMVRKEKLASEVEELKIESTHVNLELIGIDKRTEIERMLKEKGSTLHAPTRPATMITIDR